MTWELQKKSDDTPKPPPPPRPQPPRDPRRLTDGPETDTGKSHPASNRQSRGRRPVKKNAAENALGPGSLPCFTPNFTDQLSEL